MKTLLKPGIYGDSGFTLIELVIVIVILGVLASVGIPVIGGMIDSSKENATKRELLLLKTAIVGQTGAAELRGYENDVGLLPPDLTGLVSKPAGVSNWDRFTQTGWNGPYIESDNNEYLVDAWGVNYIYDAGARTIRSAGGSDTLTVAF
jgi:prepilin-type N-terminal cleavage/methylation domain-containing protein